MAKILIVGRSATGKDTLAQILHDKYNMTFVKSHTSRPARFEGEDTHVFVSFEEAQELVKSAVTWTVIDGNYYFAMRQSVEDNDAYIIDPRGLFELVKNMPDTDFQVVYISADKNRRKEASLGRVKNENRENESKVFDSRIAAEDGQFSEFEEMIEKRSGFPENVVCVQSFVNDYAPETLEKAAAEIVAMNK